MSDPKPFRMTEMKPLTIDCKPGDYVSWSTVGGKKHEGVLKEWDNGTAIVLVMSGKEIAVRCR